MRSSKKVGISPVIAYWSPDQYEELRSLSEDKDTMCEDFDEWARVTADAIKNLRECGAEPVPMPIDLYDLLHYCATEQKPLNGATRAQFAQLKAEQLMELSAISLNVKSD